MVANRHASLILLVLVLSGCSTIATEPPKDLSNYAEVDIKTTNGSPEIQIDNVAVLSGFTSKYFGPARQSGPIILSRLFLSPDDYQIQYECFGTISIGYIPLFNVTVERGKKYWLGCEHRSENIEVYIKEQQ